MDIFIYGWMLFVVFSFTVLQDVPLGAMFVQGISWFLYYSLVETDFPIVNEPLVVIAIDQLFVFNLVMSVVLAGLAVRVYVSQAPKAKRPKGDSNLKTLLQGEEVVNIKRTHPRSKKSSSKKPVARNHHRQVARGDGSTARLRG